MHLEPQSPPHLWTTLKRGLCLRCPACGQGRVFVSYIKPVEACAACHEPLGHIRADDGPAWLTILVVGHILAPFFVFFKDAATWPIWMWAVVLPGVVIGLTLALLPMAKGLFIAMLWRMQVMRAA